MFSGETGTGLKKKLIFFFGRDRNSLNIQNFFSVCNNVSYWGVDFAEAKLPDSS